MAQLGGEYKELACFPGEHSVVWEHMQARARHRAPGRGWSTEMRRTHPAPPRHRRCLTSPPACRSHPLREPLIPPAAAAPARCAGDMAAADRQPAAQDRPARFGRAGRVESMTPHERCKLEEHCWGAATKRLACGMRSPTCECRIPACAKLHAHRRQARARVGDGWRAGRWLLGCRLGVTSLKPNKTGET